MGTPMAPVVISTKLILHLKGPSIEGLFRSGVFFVRQARKKLAKMTHG